MQGMVEEQLYRIWTSAFHVQFWRQSLILQKVVHLNTGFENMSIMKWINLYSHIIKIVKLIIAEWYASLINDHKHQKDCFFFFL